MPQFKDTLGWIQYHRGEHKTAQPYLDEALAELPDVALVRYHAGMNYVALGDVAKRPSSSRRLTPADAPLGEKIRTAMQLSLKN